MSKTNIQPVTKQENDLIGKVSQATFPAGSSHKRFMRNFGPPESHKLSDEGRAYLAYIAWRYRKQYALNPSDLDFIHKWIYEPKPEHLIKLCRIFPYKEPDPLEVTDKDVEQVVGGLFQ